MIASLDILVVISWRVAMMLSSMTFLLGILLGVTHACMESADIDRTWPHIWALIF